MSLLITNIQRFSLHDGPGIRTTIFLKGCSLRCPWCCNPENINPYSEPYHKNGEEGIYGKEYTVEEVFTEIMKDKNFYEPDGGVTFSGGEAMLQAKEILPLLKMVKDAGVTTAIETCLFAPADSLEMIIPYIDYFYVDMKIPDSRRCREILKGDIEVYKKNMEALTEKKNIVIRIPVIGGYTEDEANRNSIINELKKYHKSIIKVELMKENNLGASKYVSLDIEPPKYIGVDDKLLENYRQHIESLTDIPAEICGT